jgi:hypothetical protein
MATPWAQEASSLLTEQVWVKNTDSWPQVPILCTCTKGSTWLQRGLRCALCAPPFPADMDSDGPPQPGMECTRESSQWSQASGSLNSPHFLLDLADHPYPLHPANLKRYTQKADERLMDVQNPPDTPQMPARMLWGGESLDPRPFLRESPDGHPEFFSLGLAKLPGPRTLWAGPEF